jgi:hypothetical protein
LLKADAIGKLYQRKKISESARSLELIRNLVEGIDNGDLSPEDWDIRRFLIHVLPDGFHRIRHYGLLASGVRKNRLAKIRALLFVQPPEQTTAQESEPEVTPLTLREPWPYCGGPMRIIEIFRRGQKPMSRASPREQAA